MSDWLGQRPSSGDGDWMGDPGEQRPEQDPRWGRELRLCAERCLRGGDSLAAESIKQMIKPYIRFLIKSFPAEYQIEATELLTAKAYLVLLEGYDRADNLGAYLTTSLANERNSTYRRFMRDRKLFKSLEAMSEFERDRLESRRPPQEGGDLLQSDRAIEDSIADEHIQQRLNKFIEDARSAHEHVLVAVGRVLERCYRTEESITEAARQLGYPKSEVATIQQRVSRERRNPNSRLSRLARDILSDDGG